MDFIQHNETITIIIRPDMFVLPEQKYDKTALERRKTLGHLRSINRNMIIHFANQSQTCELLKKKKKFRTFHEKNLWKVVQSIPDWTDRENPYRLSYYIYIYVCVSSSWHNSLTF